MDPEIQQLLKSLDIETTPPSQPRPAPPIRPVVVPQTPSQSWIQRYRSLVVKAVCLGASAGIFVLFFMYGLPEGWSFRGRKVVRIHESATSELMALPSSSMKKVSWSAEENFPSALPEGSLLAEHMDILKGASGRRAALEELKRDIDGLMTACVHTPDRLMAEALHRAIVRFDATDLDLTHSLISLIVSKKPLLKTPNDVQRLNETLSIAGLGRGLEEYSAVTAHLASSKQLVQDSLMKLRSSQDVVRLASDFEVVSQLLDGVQKNPLLCSSMNIEALRREAADLCRASIQRVLAQASEARRHCSAEERLAVAFLQKNFSDVGIDQWARVDGALLPYRASRSEVVAYNSLGTGERYISSAKVFLAPDIAVAFDEPELSEALATESALVE